jgi:hypothetical protein
MTDSKIQLEESVRHIGQEIEAIANGDYYVILDEHGDVETQDLYTDKDVLSELLHQVAQEGQAVVDEAKQRVGPIEDGNYSQVLELFEKKDKIRKATVFDYFDDCLDIKYTVGHDGSYLDCEVLVTFGGPNIYVNRTQVEGYWGSDKAFYPLSCEAKEAIDEFGDDRWQLVRQC